ncbi:hypothetical protein BH09ACT1_BH09ACT1_10200 [soil metagenome]
MTASAPQIVATASALAAFGDTAAQIDALDDDALIGAQTSYAEYVRLGQSHGAWIAAAIARRSSHEFGLSGLAKREGHVSPEAMIQSISGSTRDEAAKLIRVGTMMAAVDNFQAAEQADPALPFDAPWQQPVVVALQAGRISLDAAESIRRGLGGIDDAVTADLLRGAAELLLVDALTLDADRLYRRAREVRDELDADGVARRQKERRDQQYFSAKRCADGMVRGSFALADEDGGFLLSIRDRATQPKLGGPRFVEQGEVARTAAIADDPRTPGQLFAEAIIGVLQIGIDADPNVIVGQRRPAVRVIVSEKTLRDRRGAGYLEGSSDPVSLETVERQLCSTGTVGVKFDDDGQCVNVGRDQRLFTQRQRIGLAVRDGGCRFPDCERPPSWCEAHHIDYWHRDDGRTDIADGILLCRNHHMLIHDNHWTIERQATPDEGTQYWLTPPPGLNKAQRPYLMPSKSSALLRLVR